LGLASATTEDNVKGAGDAQKPISMAAAAAKGRTGR